MFRVALRKMLSNKWMLVCTLLGTIITVAMLSSIPTYTSGIMQRMLSKDLENSQATSNKYPGGYLIEFGNLFTGLEKDNANYNYFDKKITGVVEKSIQLPIQTQNSYIQSDKVKVFRSSAQQEPKNYALANISAMSDFKDHIKLLHGTLPAAKKNNGVYEVILSEEAMYTLNLTLGNTYEISKGNINDTGINFKIKVVGIFTYNKADDPYWFNPISEYKECVFMDMDLMRNTYLQGEEGRVYKADWYVAYDYNKIKLHNLPELQKTYEDHVKWFNKYRSYLSYDLAAHMIIDQYGNRVKQLKTTLLVLQIPILIILAFYSFMVAKLKIDFESNEIAVMKSRGGSSLQVFLTYLFESLMIGAVALAVGPVLGLYLCKILGASNGFMEFVNRSALPLSLDAKAYSYSLAAVLFISISMLIPAFMASRTSIVLYKQKNARQKKSVFWKKYLVDLILLGIAFYGLYSYQRQQKVLFVSSAKGTDLGIDPLLFIISVLFVFGSGLLILRIFPYIIRLIFWLGRKIWNPVFYASFIQVGRTSGQEQFTMLFIILTLSIGIFSANSARTINKNMEEKVQYQTGANIVVEGHWTNNDTSILELRNGPPPAGTIKDPIVYFEPPYAPFTKLSGVESITKVLKRNDATALCGSGLLYDVPLMGIIPNEFGKTAWFKNSLLPHHWYQYLNLLTDSPKAVLVSSAFKENLKAKEGDSIQISWGENRNIEGIIYAFVDYWPTLNPNIVTKGAKNPYFVIANLSYIQAMNPIEPYQVWMKKKPGVTSTEVYQEMTDQKIELDSRSDALEQIILKKNDPMLQGTNGSLSLSFIVVVIISIIGFLIYWVMSIKKRVLQFGVFRAVGLTSRSVIGMIACEQFLITGTSILAGIELGNLTSRIFVPMFQMVYGAEEQVPPFQVISYASDYLRLYCIVALMLVLCFFVLWRIISRIEISQALKLGED